MTEAEWCALADAAKAACERAYCPYSDFPVGAAAMWGNEAIASGCNVENASFGLTICAERNAIFRAVADGARSIIALAIYTPTPMPVTPCGACRQVLAEFGHEAEIRCLCDGSNVEQFTLADLLPRGFALAKPR
ncbi:MAG TPA: cytidine deaminase [Casimicrobiaceae bacterium]|nr:cytidine deaminase [Casimicrobiaceae bacterium]